MWVGVLGPLEVSHEGVSLPVRAAKHRILLAALLVHANQVVSFDALAEMVWDGSPASGARATVRNYVARLRQVIGAEAGGRIVTSHPGYEFRADDSELDLLKFQALCRDGSEAVRRAEWPRARRLLADALALWRGPALADVGSELLRRDHALRLEHTRLQAIEWRVDADLHLGECADLAGELQSLAALHPLRERFHAQLMLVLYRQGRQAEALVAYRDARKILSEELGIEPGPELQRLHEGILRADARLEPTEPRSGSVPPPTRVTPRQLPTAPTASRRFACSANSVTSLSRPQPSTASDTRRPRRRLRHLAPGPSVPRRPRSPRRRRRPREAERPGSACRPTATTKPSVTLPGAAMRGRHLQLGWCGVRLCWRPSRKAWWLLGCNGRNFEGSGSR